MYEKYLNSNNLNFKSMKMKHSNLKVRMLAYTSILLTVITLITSCDKSPDSEEVAEIAVSETILSFSASGSSSSITVVCEKAWTATVPNSADWVTIDPKVGVLQNEVSVSVAENLSSTARSTTITFSSKSDSKTVQITQAGVSLTVTPTSLYFQATAFSQTFDVTTSASGYSVSSDQSWCTVTKNGNTVSVSVLDNLETTSRSASVNVTAGEKTTLVAVSQAAISSGAWVLINGVKWATRNVDAPGTFASSPYSSGMIYQWNRKIGWSSNNPMVNSNGGSTWDSSTPSGTAWTTVNDPSPSGYRVPTLDELKSLLNTTYVTNQWITLNGVSGRIFSDKTTGNCIFLPASGYRNGNGGTLGLVGSDGGYWSGTQNENSSDAAYGLYFYSDASVWNSYGRSGGHSVRCVSE